MKQIKQTRQIKHEGQTLVVLLVLVSVALIITTASVIIMTVNNTAATRFDRGQVVLDVAESGMENALMRMLRDPNYIGETLTIGEGSAVITVSGSGFPKTITSKGTVGITVRTIQTQVDSTNNVLSVVSWREVYQ
jgi:Na+-transporting NADH:ubiquinone oxidoreductase subunit NqrC